MIGFQAPLWLLLLGLIPLIRWLHRFRFDSTTWPSTTLFLWVGLQRQTPDKGSPGEPDPRWMLRALITGLLILMLAKPFLQDARGQPVEVWIDDSLSMFTLERSQTRIQAGLLQLQSYLDEHGFSRIELHSLGDPAARLSLDPEDSANWAARMDAWTSQPRSEPLLPPAVTLSKRANHILITDGADKAVNRWAQTAPLVHIIRTGELRQNFVLGEFSLRDSMLESEPVQGSARVHNLGESASRLRLVIKQRDNIVEALDLEIPPWGSALSTFSIDPGNSGSLVAQLESSDDPLLQDNNLALDIASQRSSIGYTLFGDCAPGFRAVIRSHPAFVKVDDGADVLINCSDELVDSMLPTLRLHPARDLRHTAQAAHWHQQLTMGLLPVFAGVAYSNTAPVLSSQGIPILSADGRILILQNTGSRKVIECYLDTHDAAFSREALYPLLMLALLGRLSDGNLETAPQSIRRNIAASRILAEALPVNTAPRVSVQSLESITTPSDKLILFAVLLLLLADAALGLYRASSSPGSSSR
jgi:hypothetical protein